MVLTSKRILSVVAAFGMAAALVSAAGADWVSAGGSSSRTGFTNEVALPPLSVAWKYATDPGNTYNVSPVVVGQMLYWVTDVRLVAMSATTGIPVWAYRAAERIRTSPAYYDGMLYFGADNGVFYAVDADTGEELWHRHAERAIRSSPAIEDGTVYFGTNDARVFAVDAKTGKDKWVFRASDDIYAPIAATRDTVWVACTDNILYGIDARRGRERWRMTFPGAGGLYFAPAVEGRRAYLAVKDQIYRVSASGTGSKLGGALSGRISAPPALGRHYLYVGCADGWLYALDTTRGRKRWTYRCSGGVQAQPLVAGNLVVVGGSQGEIVALDANTGAVRWSYGQQAPWAPERAVGYQLMAAAASGGALYLSWDDGNLACLTADAVDIEPPHISDLTPPDAESPGEPVSPTGDLTISATIYDEGSGVAADGVTITLGGKPLALTRTAAGKYSHTLDVSTTEPALEDGWHTVVVTAQDQRGNKVTKTWAFLSYMGVTAHEDEAALEGVGETERF